MLKKASLLVATLALNAAAFDQIKDVRTMPVVDMRLGAVTSKLMTLPTIPQTVSFGIPTLPNIATMQMAEPVQTAPWVDGKTAAGTKIGADANGDARYAPSIKGTVQNFDAQVGKDEQTNAGAGTGELSAKFFDNVISLREDQAIPHAENVALIAHEIEAPPEQLRAHGIQGTVVVYGSARIPSPEAAQTLFKETVAKYGRKPQSKEGREALVTARQALKNSSYYELARKFGALVAKGGQGKVAVVTGGGPGIMEGANRGAFEAGGPSVGYNIKLGHEQGLNQYTTPGLSFEFTNFASRKMNLRHGALAMVYFPGGFGTMDEFFEVITLMQTGKIARRPIVLVGEKAYWDKIVDFEQFAKMGMISQEDLKLFRYAETADQAWAIVRGQKKS